MSYGDLTASSPATMSEQTLEFQKNAPLARHFSKVQRVVEIIVGELAVKSESNPLTMMGVFAHDCVTALHPTQTSMQLHVRHET